MKKKILLADDDPELNEGMAELLADEGFEVCSVTNGLDAVKKAAKEPFDLAVLDYTMDGMDGVEVLTELRKKDPGLKAIFVSGKPFIENLTKIDEISQGIACVFSKPFDPVKFLEAVKKYTV